MITKDPLGVDSLSAALAYHALGWSIIPVAADKKPSVKWKLFQTNRADEQQIRDWFDKRDDLGLGVVLGAVSGGLTCRDFDVEAAYRTWAAQNPELAKTLPTAKTARGFHVYFLSELDHTEKFTDGELRGKGAYVVIPPSCHPSGVQYRWIIPPTTGIPKLDYQLFQSTYLQKRQSNMASVSSVSSVSSVGSSEWDGVIACCLPTKERERNAKIFELARWLKAEPALKDAGSTVLEQIVRKWHQRALPVIATKSFSETMADFEHAWDSVKFPKGMNVVEAVWPIVRAGTWPSEAEKYDSEDMRWLVALCLGLQDYRWPERQFFLSCRDGGKVLHRDHNDVAKWLKMFVHDGLLAAFPQPGRRKATRYCYLGPSWKEPDESAS